jgi:hypothetical protein
MDVNETFCDAYQMRNTRRRMPGGTNAVCIPIESVSRGFLSLYSFLNPPRVPRIYIVMRHSFAAKKKKKKKKKKPFFKPRRATKRSCVCAFASRVCFERVSRDDRSVEFCGVRKRAFTLHLVRARGYE